MVNKADKNTARLKRHKRVRGKISGTTECPRLNVFPVSYTHLDVYKRQVVVKVNVQLVVQVLLHHGANLLLVTRLVLRNIVPINLS